MPPIMYASMKAPMIRINEQNLNSFYVLGMTSLPVTKRME